VLGWVLGLVLHVGEDLDDGLSDLSQVADLFRRERVEDRVTDRLDVAWSGARQQRETLRGQDSELSATIGGVGAPLHKAFLFQTGDSPGEAAAGEFQAFGELGHANGALRETGQVGEQEVIGMGDARVAPQLRSPDEDLVAQHLALFDRLDFESWNGRDWELFRQLHSDDVHVEGFGATTDGIEAHLAWAQAFVKSAPDTKVLAHPIRIGASDWTAVTGLLPTGSMVTLARWQNGRIAEEYLFAG
jgi:hypothetical protein